MSIRVNLRYIQTIRILFFSILIVCFLQSCGNDKKEYVDLPFDRNTTPTMQDDSVSVLISDSGIIRYKMITDIWLSYDRSNDPFWFFPAGIYVEQFDESFHKQATLKADSAWNFHRKKLWRLKGNVFMKNIKDEVFKTDEVYWDEYQQRIYSDKYIEIYKPDELTLRGYGFESNMNMSQYRIYRPFDSPFVLKDDENQSASVPQPVAKTQGKDSIK